MQFVTTRQATRLTGLSTEQLREWTSRRALIPPDVKAKGHGSPAHHALQTILRLRLTVVLRERFKLEIHAHRGLFAELGAGLAGNQHQLFPALGLTVDGAVNNIGRRKHG